MNNLSPLEFTPKTILAKHDPESKIKQYLILLKLENQKINLVSRETSDADLERLAAESILPFEIIENRSFDNYLDIGSGGGFPAFPIMMSAKVGKATLIERTTKKALVLGRMAGELGLKIKILDSNFEECQISEKFDLITLRLVKLTKPLLKRIFQLLKPAGTFVYYAEFKDVSESGLKSHSYSYTSASGSPVKYFTVFTKQ